MSISAIFTPTLSGIMADRWVDASYLFSVCHIFGALALMGVPHVRSQWGVFVVMLLYNLFYYPTLSLSSTVSYVCLHARAMPSVTYYPWIRVWGTVGFISALWTVALSGLETSSRQFYLAAGASVVLAIYSLISLPRCPPLGHAIDPSFTSQLGLDAFMLFRRRKMGVFFVFVTLIGACLQLANAYADVFLHDLRTAAFPDADPSPSPSFDSASAGAMLLRYPAVLLSLSQVSEVFCILLIPVFMGRCGIKVSILLSTIAWTLRFGLLAFSSADRVLLVVLSCLFYGPAFDFFLISGSLYVDLAVEHTLRASAQGLFMMMVAGVGSLLGNLLAGLLVSLAFTDEDGARNWMGIWLTFAGYAAVITVLFGVFFHDTDPEVEVVDGAAAGPMEVRVEQEEEEGRASDANPALTIDAEEAFSPSSTTVS